MKRIIMLLLAAALLCTCAAGAEVYLDREPPESWKDKDLLVLTAFSTPINDSALLEVGGVSILIDGGFKGQRFDMEKVLAELGYDGHVNIIYNTHPHDDHIGAVIYMMRFGFTADEFISTFPEDYPDERQQKAVSLLKDAGIPYRQIRNGETLEIGGASFRFLYYPDGRDPNALSSMAHITFGNATLLMTADVTNASMRYFHANLAPGEIRADIMKFPHHAILRMENEFVDDVSPKFVYITNRKKETPRSNRQLEIRGIPYKHTSVGRIVMTTDGNDWYVMQYKDLY